MLFRLRATPTLGLTLSGSLLVARATWPSIRPLSPNPERQPKSKSSPVRVKHIIFFGCRSGLGLKGRIEGQVALATSSDPDKVSPKKWAPRVGDTVFSEKVSVSRRRTPYFLSLPI